MQTRFEFRCSYQDMVAYDVIGQADVFSVESYQNTTHGLEYMRSTFNHCGDPTSFERNILSRQGGAVVHTRTDAPARWTPEFYTEFVLWLHAKYINGKQKWAEMCERRGWGAEELAQYESMRPIPKAMYWSQEESTYLVEPWWTPNHACDYCVNISKMTGVLNCPIHAEICDGTLGATTVPEGVFILDLDKLGTDDAKHARLTPIATVTQIIGAAADWTKCQQS